VYTDYGVKPQSNEIHWRFSVLVSTLLEFCIGFDEMQELSHLPSLEEPAWMGGGGGCGDTRKK